MPPDPTWRPSGTPEVAAKPSSACSSGSVRSLSTCVEEGKIHGVAALGGAEGSVLAASAMRELPVGFPKLLVSPIASGRRTFAPFVGTKDVLVMHSVVDILGLNPMARSIYDNAAAAIAGMAKSFATSEPDATNSPADRGDDAREHHETADAYP